MPSINFFHELKMRILNLNNLISIDCFGLGDTLCASPIIKHLYKAYQQPLDVASFHPELFTRSPYVNQLYDYNRSAILPEKYNRHNIHYLSFNISILNYRRLKYQQSNITSFFAMCLGFYLTNNDRTLEFFAKPYEPIEELPNEYIVIHPAVTWPSRTWIHWQEFINKCNFPIVAVGKKGPQIKSKRNLENKGVFELDIPNGLNLVNKTDLSQLWHVIDKAKTIITMDSGILHLAGTTNTHITLLNHTRHPEYHLPFRKGTQYYKTTVLQGACDKYCTSDFTYSLKEFNTIEEEPDARNCLENYPEFRCHATLEQVLNSIDKLIHN